MDRSVEEMVAAAMRGDAVAFAGLIDRFERRALAVAWVAGARGDVAGEIVQEAFFRAWQNLARLESADRFGVWLCRIVRNLAMDLRRVSKHGSIDKSPDPIDVRDAPLESAVKKESAADINSALAELDEISRAVVVLRYYDGLSSAEIGEILETSAQAVDMRLSRARQQLRLRLGDMLDPDKQRSLT